MTNTEKTKRDLTYAIKMKGLELGFTKVGITNADDFPDYLDEIAKNPDYQPWINEKSGFYAAKGARPKSFFPEAKSIICAIYGYGDIVYPDTLSKYIGYSYLARCFNPLKTSSAGIRLEAFKNFLVESGCGLYTGDIAIPARRACARAGLVDFGKNNFAYTDETGSFIILYAFLVDTELEYDKPTVKTKCPPNCTACVDSCPTKALSVGKLNPTKCMLFNNINTYEIPVEQRENMGTRIHGCDICQKACPRNRKILKNASRRDYFLEELEKEFDIEKVLLMDEQYYQTVIYPIMYNYIRDLNYFRRNAAIAMGNSGNKAYIASLKKVLDNENEQVRDAAQWAITKLERADKL